MPVFVTWSEKPEGPPTRSRSWLTSSGVASDRTAPSKEEPNLSTRLRGPKVRWSFDRSGLASQNRSLSKPKPLDVPRPFLGRPLSRPASLQPRSGDRFETASRWRKIDSSGASSRLAPLPLRRASALPAGGDRTFGHLPHRLALAGLSARPGPPSRSPEHHAPPARVAKAKNAAGSLWITGISGTTVGAFLRGPLRLPIRSPCPTSGKCLNPQH